MTSEIPNRQISKYESIGALIKTRLKTVVVNNIWVTLNIFISDPLTGLNFLYKSFGFFSSIQSLGLQYVSAYHTLILSLHNFVLIESFIMIEKT